MNSLGGGAYIRKFQWYIWFLFFLPAADTKWSVVQTISTLVLYCAPPEGTAYEKEYGWALVGFPP